MPRYSAQSLTRLEQAHPLLKELFLECIVEYDHVILCSHRGEKEQNDAFYSGRSQKKWPDGKHNALPSLAVDAAPYPIDWDDHERFRDFGHFVKDMASRLLIPIIWGGDWKNFIDLPHFELVLKP